jgi:hypothetical protein
MAQRQDFKLETHSRAKYSNHEPEQGMHDGHDEAEPFG